MKRIGIITGMLLMLVACKNSTNNEASNSTGNSGAPYMYFKEETYDAGKINQGDKVTHVFVVENRGRKDLQILNVQTSCGCTVPTYDQRPVAPGKSAKIEVVFNSYGKVGTQNKEITVISNAVPDTKILKLHCEVIEPNNKSKKE
jgi:hypothetical protein